MASFFGSSCEVSPPGFVSAAQPVTCAALTTVKTADLVGLALGAAGFAYFAARAHNHGTFDGTEDIPAQLGNEQATVEELTLMRHAGVS
ncbi:hypothetical protein [Kutzneria buriramensis]|nr:hypothetical protein [Kutzneria buriramensis]